MGLAFHIKGVSIKNKFQCICFAGERPLGSLESLPSLSIITVICNIMSTGICLVWSAASYTLLFNINLGGRVVFYRGRELAVHTSPGGRSGKVEWRRLLKFSAHLTATRRI